MGPYPFELLFLFFEGTRNQKYPDARTNLNGQTLVLFSIIFEETLVFELGEEFKNFGNKAKS